MDFYKLRKELSDKWSLEDDDWSELEKTAILSFERDVDSNNIFSKYGGRMVFRHKNHEDRIFEGETWICSLVLKNNYYFAKGLQRLDGSFMLELKREQMEDIADAVWNSQKDKIEPVLEEKYKEVMKKAVGEKVAEAVDEKDSEIRDLNAQIEELEQRDSENRQIILSLEEKVRKAESRPMVPLDAPAMPPSASLFRTDRAEVERIGPDELYSKDFNRTRYFVHISSDYRILLVRPHDSGDVICIDNKIVLNGLSMALQFSGPTQMISEYSPEYGGILIHLR
ncbi:MAG: hypothetical protein GX137_05255 [Thermoplasmatales archaeon]|jgi:hypothetical protein|nr:hypothetical protein [Thermoplasmatales archaeon]